MSEELQDQSVIELKYVARALNKIIGPNFRVIVNGSTRIADDNKTEVLLQCTRIPFSLTGIGSETLDISLEIWASAQNADVRDAMLADLNKLIGHRSGEIETPEADYTFASFLEFGKPIDVQQVDIGAARKHLLNITGTMLVSNSKTGAVISNAIKTQLFIGDPKDENTVRGFIPALAVETSLSFSLETAPIGNHNTADVVHNLRGVNFSISALVLKRPLESAILRIIHLCQAGFGLNDVIFVRRVFPDMDIIKKCRLLGGEITEQAGAYLQYKLSLQEVP